MKLTEELILVLVLWWKAEYLTYERRITTHVFMDQASRKPPKYEETFPNKASTFSYQRKGVIILNPLSFYLALRSRAQPTFGWKK